ncbi:heat shock protein hsp9 [Aspergillus udagawae]|uniref:Heat shock protein hsp9 n=1 Tax=Aspergillus udagawae TaxID=91492 RepID=A0A8H3S6D2_9EURO|nr:heat shock protein hsp9 [Aspergillus udagawae]GFF51848.1 heat shock protein hsp9 [Aspergillus udagawae]GFF78721.1 heat shock protein hsp9 [Aspergillus udagawae]GFG08433.1 heat shock protein hsp9 [Aspergillus udagawae]GFG24971.1 heat shock protein hsp9 [Aspergillus udagawae]
MSDTGRKDFSTKAKEEITPDSQKSTLDKMKETVTDATDRLTGSAQGDKQKSYTQQAYDSMRGEKDDQVHGSSTQTMGQKAKDAMGLGDH